MSTVKLIVPEGGQNLITNPSFEKNVTDGWTYTGAGGSAARSATRARYGAYAAKLDGATGGTATFQSNAFTLADDESVSMSAMLYLDTSGGGISVQIGLDAGGYLVSDSSHTEDAWNEVLLSHTNTTGGNQTVSVLVTITATVGKFCYLDGVQMEKVAYNTTYMDGEQPGCSWDGEAHNSTSTRKETGPGGRVRDMEDDLGLPVGEFHGRGAPPMVNVFTPLALLPGGRYEHTRLEKRQLTIQGTMKGNALANLHVVRKPLVRALVSPIYEINERPRPRILRYTGSDTDREAGVVYDAGLEMNRREGFADAVSLRLIAPDPLVYERFDSAMELDTNDTATIRLVAARRDGAWNMLGPPDALGTYTSGYTILAAQDAVYIGGDFANFDNIAAADGIVKLNPADITYSALGSGVGSGTVRKIIEGPDGDIWAVGTFLNMGGVAAADYVARWDGAWNAVGVPLSGAATINAIYDILIASDGLVYIAGDFTAIDDETSADYIAVWNGTTWSAVGAGLNNIARALAEGPDGTIYVGGDFTAIGGGGAAISFMAAWDGSAYSQVGDAFFDDSVHVLLGLPNGDLIAGGDFENYNTSLERLHVARFNGETWVDMSGGLGVTAGTDAVYALVERNGLIYAGGEFGFARGVVAVDSGAAWTGTEWIPFDFLLPAGGQIRGITFYGNDMYIAISNTGTATFAGSTTIAYGGTAVAYPTIRISRSGGTSATVKTIRNEESAAIIYMDYDLLDGEEVVFVLHPQRLSITSSHFGDITNSITSYSNLANFVILPGAGGDRDNLITSLVEVSGATVNASIAWRNAYVSMD